MKLADVAPRIGAAHAAEQARRMDSISRCWQRGWHALGCGPCFDTPEGAIRHRDREDRLLLQRIARGELPYYPEASRNRILWRLGERDEP